jgi:hypothetical protein
MSVAHSTARANRRRRNSEGLGGPSPHRPQRSVAKLRRPGRDFDEPATSISRGLRTPPESAGHPASGSAARRRHRTSWMPVYCSSRAVDASELEVQVEALLAGGSRSRMPPTTRLYATESPGREDIESHERRRREDGAELRAGATPYTAAASTSPPEPNTITWAHDCPPRIPRSRRAWPARARGVHPWRGAAPGFFQSPSTMAVDPVSSPTRP